MRKRIILISGFARSGKDTLANALRQRIGMHKTKVFKFATPLRQSLHQALAAVGLGTVDLWTEEPTLKAQLRPLMVEFGRFCRAQDKDVFVKATHGLIADDFRNGLEVAIIADCRYLNEAQLTRKVGQEAGLEVQRVNIRTHGVQAANLEEMTSMAALDDGDAADYDASFEMGDIQSIERAADHLAGKGKSPHAELLDANIEVRLLLERMDARLKRLEVDRG